VEDNNESVVARLVNEIEKTNGTLTDVFQIVESIA
jgi:hypothetical protein